MSTEGLISNGSKDLKGLRVKGSNRLKSLKVFRSLKGLKRCKGYKRFKMVQSGLKVYMSKRYVPIVCN